MKLTTLICVATIVGLTCASGVIHGLYSNRWGVDQRVIIAGKKLEQLPDQFDANWKLAETITLEDSTVDILQCERYVNRRYVNRKTDASVHVVLILGPGGPTAIHTPEICVPARSYSQIGNRRTTSLPDWNGAAFWASTFKSRGLEGGLMRIYYSWSTGEQWLAPERPRFTVGTSEYLYKIQVVCGLPLDADLTAPDPCHAFLKDFLPVAQRYLVPAQKS